MLYVATTRWDFLNFLPKGGCVAEIGVFRGAFSEMILRNVRPSKFHLIDPWIVHDDPDYSFDPANSNQSTHNSHFNEVKDKFSTQINEGIVELHRTTSTEAVSLFPDNYFDFIYVDAMHYHAAVLNDLVLFQNKLKKGGIIGGHDFAEHDLAEKMNFGVISAVQTFVKRTAFNFEFITCKDPGLPFPSYFLCTDLGAKWVQECTLELLDKNVQVVQIPDCVAGNFMHQKLTREGKEPLYLPSFGR